MKLHSASLFLSALSIALFFTAAPLGAQSPGAAQANNAAYALFAEGNYAEAATAYEQLLRDYPTDAVVSAAQIQLAFAYYFLGQFEKAEEQVKRILSGPPLPEELKQIVEGLEPQILSAKAANMPEGDPKRKSTFEQAIAKYSEYVTNYPQAGDLESVIYARAVAHYQIQNYDDVVKDMELNTQRFAQSATIASSKNLLALALATLGSQSLNTEGGREEAFTKYDQATKLLREIIRERRDIALYNEANYQLGEILFNKAAFSDEEDRPPLYAEALEAYRSIVPREEIIAMQQDLLATFPQRRAEAIQARNQTLLRQLERDNIRELTKLEELKNKTDQVAGAVQKMGEIFFQQGDLNASRTLLRHVSPHLKAEEDAKRNLYFTTMTYAMQGNAEKALEGYTAFQSDHKGDPLADNLPIAMGNMFLAQDNPEESIRYFDESVAIYPDGRFVGLSVVSKAAAEARLGRYDVAEKTFRDFLARNPSPEVGVVAQAGLAGVLKDTGKWAEAVAEYKVVMEKFPGTPQAVEAQYWVGIGAQQTGENQAAIELLDAFVKEHGDHPLAPLALYAKGGSLIATGDREGGLAALAEVAEKYPDSPPAPFTYFTRAQFSGEAGNAEELISIMRQFIEKYPQDDKVFVAFESIAQTQINSGNTAEGLATYREFAASHSESPEAAIALQKAADLQRTLAEGLGRYSALDESERAQWKEGITASIETIEQLIKTYPESPQIALALRTLLQNQRLLQGAELKDGASVEEYFQTMADQADNQNTKSKILFALADYVSEQDSARALEIMTSAYNPAVVYAPEDLDSYGLALVREGKLDDAQAVFEKLAQDYPLPAGVELTSVPATIQIAQATALFGKARVLQEQGQTASAGQLFKELKEKYAWTPKALEADYGIAAAMREERKFDEANAILGGVIRSATATAELRANSMLLFGDIMADQMKLATTPEAQENFRGAAIDNYIKIAQFYAGVPAAAARGLWEGAQLIEQQAAASQDNNFRRQQLNRAKAFYEQLVSEYPNSEFAAKAKERVAAMAN